MGAPESTNSNVRTDFNNLYLPIYWPKDDNEPGILNEDERYVHPTLMAINAYRKELGLPQVDIDKLTQDALAYIKSGASKEIRHPLLTQDINARNRIPYEFDLNSIPSEAHKKAVAELVKAAAFAELYYNLQKDPNYLEQFDAVLATGDIERLRHFWQKDGAKCLSVKDENCSSVAGLDVKTDPNGIWWPDEFTQEDISSLLGRNDEENGIKVEPYKWSNDQLQRKVITPGSIVVACNESDDDSFKFKEKWYRPMPITGNERMQILSNMMAKHIFAAAGFLKEVNPQYSRMLEERASYFRNTPIFDDDRLDRLWVNTDDPEIFTSFGSTESYTVLGSPDGTKAVMQSCIAYTEPQLQSFIDGATKLIKASDEAVWKLWENDGKEYPLSRNYTTPPKANVVKIIFNGGAMNSPGYTAGGFVQPNYVKASHDLRPEEKPTRTVSFGPLIAARIKNQGLPVARAAFSAKVIEGLEASVNDIPAILKFVYGHEKGHRRIPNSEIKTFVPQLNKELSVVDICGDFLALALEEATCDTLSLFDLHLYVENKNSLINENEKNAAVFAYFGNLLRDLNLGKESEHGLGGIISFYLLSKNDVITYDKTSGKYDFNLDMLREKIGSILKEIVTVYLSYDKDFINSVRNAAIDFFEKSPMASYIAQVQKTGLPGDNLPYYIVHGELGEY